MTKKYQMVWKDDYTIHSYEADVKSRASAASLLQFMQESAWNHAEHLELGYSHLIDKNLAWVMARLKLRIHSFPSWHTRITLETWPTALDKLFAYRDFRIRSQDNSVLALGTTTWLVIDVNTRRPRRTSSYFHLEHDDQEQALGHFADKVAPVESCDSTSERKVTFSHLDVNGHVNNVKYLEYVIDNYSYDFLNAHHLYELEMNFLNEALLGDTLNIRTRHVDERTHIHSLSNVKDKRECCRIKTIWEKTS